MEMEPSRVDERLFREATAKAIDDRRNAARRRLRLRRWILSAVGDPKMHESTAGRAADLVVYCGVAMAELRHILTDLNAMRPKLRSPGAFFTDRLQELAYLHDIDWKNPRRKNP